jgi:hypothetical protein
LYARDEIGSLKTSSRLRLIEARPLVVGIGLFRRPGGGGVRSVDDFSAPILEILHGGVGALEAMATSRTVPRDKNWSGRSAE